MEGSSKRKDNEWFVKQIKFFDKNFSKIKKYKLRPWQESYIKRVKEYLIQKPYTNKKLLDVGAGHGYIAIEMAKLGLDVVACDLSPKAIEHLERNKKIFKLKNLKIVHCNAQSLPFANESFDHVVAIAILEHIPEEEKAIKEWKRVLKKGGKMYVVTPLLFRYLWPMLWPVNYVHDRRLGHLRRYDLATLKRKFKLKPVAQFYTGNLLKIVGLALTTILPSRKLDQIIETLDNLTSHLSYGANNITVIFQKS